MELCRKGVSQVKDPGLGSFRPVGTCYLAHSGQGICSGFGMTSIQEYS